MHPALAILIGLLIGAVPAVLIRTGIRVASEMSDRPVGINLYPVTVAARDLSTGAVVKMDDLSQRGIPDALATRAIVKPDSVSYVANQPLAVPLANGDSIPWHAFENVPTIEGQRPSQELVDACSTELGKRKVATAPPTVAELRKAVLEEKP
ncbi:MAG: hypothetical protein JNM17_11980 [Archangium sp.]|nr:hypothetical protein [Archangium sp.]